MAEITGSGESISRTAAHPARKATGGIGASMISVAKAPAQLVASLNALTKAENAEAQRQRQLNGKVSWWRDLIRLRASTLPRVWSSVLGFTFFSMVVSGAQILYGQEWRLSNNVVPLLSVVVAAYSKRAPNSQSRLTRTAGLLLVFRNSTAFGRWEDGRRTFQASGSTVRNMARYVWLNVGTATFDADRANPFMHKDFTEQDRQDKRDALRLMVAFVIATKHHVRGEYGLDHEDLNGLVPSSLVRKMSISMRDEMRAQGAEPSETDPLLADAEAATAGTPSTKPSLPLPSVIAHRLGMYFVKVRSKGFLDLQGPAGFQALTTFLNQLVDEMGTVERLGSMPIPAIYGIHLKQVVSIFLLVLPFCLVGELSWRMCPFITVYAFILQGIEVIATEIESPFGDDPSDLPLDLLTAELRNEVEHIMLLPETIEMKI